MYKTTLFTSLAITIALVVSACSGNSDNAAAETSTFNLIASEPKNTGDPGGDTSFIAGLWDGITTVDGIRDEVYWHIAPSGVLTRYDYQQDGVAGASGENCYLVGEPITVIPEGGEDYSISDVAVTATRCRGRLTIAFNEADKNDLDVNGNTEEMPTLSWNLTVVPALQELNSCSADSADPNINSLREQNENDPIFIVEDCALDLNPLDSIDPTEPGNPLEVLADRPLMTAAQCDANGGKIVGDPGDGHIHRLEYRCESGLEPIGSVPIGTEGSVCCV